MFIAGLIPTVLILIVLTFLFKARGKIKRQEPFAQSWYATYFVVSILGLAVAWLLFILLLITTLSQVLQEEAGVAQFMSFSHFYAPFYIAPVFGTYTLIKVRQYHKATMPSGSIPPPPLSPPQVPTPSPPTPPTPTPPNPEPSSETPKR
jgi:hypothetical protein